MTIIEVRFVETADHMEQELASGLGEGQIAELVEDEEVEAVQVIGETPVLGKGLMSISTLGMAGQQARPDH